MPTSGTITPTSQQERRSKYLWLAIILGLFVVQFTMSGVAIVLANSDPTHAVIPNYHQQALEYDKVLNARHISERLGWKWTITLDSLRTTSGKRGLILELQDAESKPLEQAEIDLSLCHHARGNQVQKVHLTPMPDQPGKYRGDAVLQRTGVWQIDVNVNRKSDHFIDRKDQYWSFAR